LKIEKISEDKIRFIFEKEELKNKNLDAKSFIYNTPESQTLFWDIMKQAENKYGFSVENSMIYVEAQSTSSGIVTLTVTKTKEDQAQKQQTSTNNKPAFKLKRKSISLDLKDILFKFQNFTDVINFCNSTKPNKNGNSTLYTLNSTYYLLVEKPSSDIIFEYSTIELRKEYILANISEYGKVIIKENAIEEIAKSNL